MLLFRRESIPLEYEAVTKNNSKNVTVSARSSVSSAANSQVQGVNIAKNLNFTLVHLGRNGGSITFTTSSIAEKHAWMEAIENQRNILVDSSKFFELQLLNDNFFKISNRVNCSVSYCGMLVVGTDDGLYAGPENVLNYESTLATHSLKRIITEEKITQVDILPDYDMLIFLAGKTKILYIRSYALFF